MASVGVAGMCDTVFVGGAGMCNKVRDGVASMCNAVGVWWGGSYVALKEREREQTERHTERQKNTMNILFEKKNNA
jgi:hypothetical protein